MSENEAHNDGPRKVSLWMLPFQAWFELFKSQESILAELPMLSSGNAETASTNEGMPNPQLQTRQNVSDFLNQSNSLERDKIESKLVRNQRVFSVMNLIWTSIVPMVVAVCFAIYQLHDLPEIVTPDNINSLATSILILYVASIVGAFVNSFVSIRIVAPLLKVPITYQLPND